MPVVAAQGDRVEVGVADLLAGGVPVRVVRALDGDAGHLVAVTLAIGAIGVVAFHLAVGRRLGLQYRERWGAAPPLSPLEQAGIVVGLLLALTGLGILLFAQPKVPSLLFLGSELLINVPCFAYFAFAHSRSRRS